MKIKIKNLKEIEADPMVVKSDGYFDIKGVEGLEIPGVYLAIFAGEELSIRGWQIRRGEGNHKAYFVHRSTPFGDINVWISERFVEEAEELKPIGRFVLKDKETILAHPKVDIYIDEDGDQMYRYRENGEDSPQHKIEAEMFEDVWKSGGSADIYEVGSWEALDTYGGYLSAEVENPRTGDAVEVYSKVNFADWCGTFEPFEDEAY